VRCERGWGEGGERVGGVGVDMYVSICRHALETLVDILSANAANYLNPDPRLAQEQSHTNSQLDTLKP